MDGSGVIHVSVDGDVDVDVHEDGDNTIWCKYTFIHILAKLDLCWRRSQYRLFVFNNLQDYSSTTSPYV